MVYVGAKTKKYANIVKRYSQLGHLVSFLMKGMTEICSERDLINRIESSRMMLQMAAVSCNTAAKIALIGGMNARDIYGISRSILEHCINFGFLYLGDDREIESLRDHAEFMFLSNRKIKKDIGGLSIEFFSQPDLSEAQNDRLEELSKKFMKKNGRKNNWSSNSIYRKIASISEKDDNSAIYLLSAATLIYELSSEYIHGSLYSHLHFFGLSQRGRMPEMADELSRTIDNHSQENLVSIAISMHGSILSFANSISNKRVLSDAQKIFEDFCKIPKNM